MDLKEQKREKWLDLARTLAIIFVSFNHAANRAFNSEKYIEYLSRPHIITFLHAMFNVISRLGVPVFLMISGALLLKRDFTDGKVVTRFLKHNLLSLFITAEIWYAIMFWYLVIFERPDFISQGPLMILWRFILNQLFINQVTMGSMWYMAMILVVYLAFPLIAIALNRFPKKHVLLCLGVLISSSMLIPNLNTLLQLSGSQIQFDFAISSENLFSMYLIFAILGFYISKGIGGVFRRAY